LQKASSEDRLGAFWWLKVSRTLGTAGAVQSWLRAWALHNVILFAHVFIQTCFHRLLCLNFVSGDTTRASHETQYDIL